MFKRVEMPMFEEGEVGDEGDVEAAFFRPPGPQIPSFGTIPYPSREHFPTHGVPPCMFDVRTRPAALYNRPVIELRGVIYRHERFLQNSCPPGTENYTKPGTKLWAMVQADVASGWSLRSEANYEQPLFGGQPSRIGFIPFVGAPFDKAGGFLSFFVPQRGRVYELSVWLRDETHGRDLMFGRPQEARPQQAGPLVIRVQAP